MLGSSSLVISGKPSSVGQELLEVVAVAALGKWLHQRGQLVVGDEALAPRDFLDTADLEALPVLDDLDELAGLHQRGERARVEPGRAAVQDMHAQPAALQIALVHGGDLQLAAGARLGPL